MNLEGPSQSQPARARRQLPVKIDHDGFRLSGGCANGYVHRCPDSGRNFSFQCGKWKREGRFQRGGDIGHSSTEPKPTVHHQHQRFARVQRTEIEYPSVRLSESAEVGCAQLRRRHTLAIHGSQSRRDVLSLNGLSSAQPMLLVQRHQGARGEWFARQQFIGRMHFDARLVVHDDQFRFVEVEHFAKLFCDP